jgi:2'-5' RNA ligase
MRLFIAVNLPPSIRDVIHADLASLRAAAPTIKWVAAPALHITLKFLGEQDERLVSDIRGALESIAERHSAFDVSTTEVGAFPNFRRPRVVWVGMTGEALLRALARDIGEALAPFGMARETRPFQAHLTVGRVRSEMRAADAAALSEAARASHPTGAFAVQAIDLMRSELGPGGSRYSLMAAVPLHARGT